MTTPTGAELLADPGVLAPGPLLAVGEIASVARQGGVAVLPWRADHLAAIAAGVPSVGSCAEAPVMPQAAVVVEKSRAGTLAQVAAARGRVAPGGRLVVVGSNAFGIATSLKQVAAWCGSVPEPVANRRRARAAAFAVDARPLPAPVIPATLTLPTDFGSAQLTTAPGVFSADGLDAGSAELLAVLSEDAACAEVGRVLDLGAGVGVLAFAALLRAEAAEALLLEADLRAVRCAEANAERLGLGARSECRWWDAGEALPASGFDLALCNPPCHHGPRGKAVELGVATAMFDQLARGLSADGRALIVANRQLPYEAPLAARGRLRCLRERAGFKVLEWRPR